MEKQNRLHFSWVYRNMLSYQRRGSFSGILIILKLVWLPNELKHSNTFTTFSDFHWLVLLDKSKKTTQIFPLLHHRCSWPDYPSHQGSVGTETGQRQGDTGLLGHSRDCYGQPDLIHELTASVILERGERGSPKLPFYPLGLPHPTRNSAPNLLA